jgi:hypothetical protein
VLSTFKVLSFAPVFWKAFSSGACTVKRAHRAAVGDVDEAAGPLMTPW